MKIKLFILLLFVFLSCDQEEKDTVSEQKNQNYLTSRNLFGNIKSLQEFSYKAIEVDGEITEGEKAIQSDSEYESYMFFNEQGNIISEKRYFIDGRLNSKYEYFYDSYGNNIKWIVYGSDESLESTHNIFFDKNRRKTGGNMTDHSGNFISKHTCEYNAEGDEIETSFFNSAGKLDSRITYKYDNKKVTESIFYDLIDSTTTKYSNTYDSCGNKIEWRADLTELNVSLLQKYKYDKFGNQIEYNFYLTKDSIFDPETYTYKFDEKNNWVRKIIYVNNKAEYIKKRKIEYYR